MSPKEDVKYKKADQIQKNYYSLREVSVYLGRHINTIRKWVDTKVIQSYAFPGRNGKEYFIKKADLNAFENQHKIGDNQ